MKIRWWREGGKNHSFIIVLFSLLNTSKCRLLFTVLCTSVSMFSAWWHLRDGVSIKTTLRPLVSASELSLTLRFQESWMRLLFGSGFQKTLSGSSVGNVHKIFFDDDDKISQWICSCWPRPHEVSFPFPSHLSWKQMVTQNILLLLKYIPTLISTSLI